MGNVIPATRVEAFSVTVPASTPQATPQVTPLTMRESDVVHVEIDVPPGHNGLTGIQLRIAGGQVLPLTPGQFLVLNNRVFERNLTAQLNSGAWQAYTYNIDVYPHVFYVSFAVVDFGPGSSADTAEPLPPTPVIA